MRLREDIFVTDKNGQPSRFYDQAKKRYVNKIMVTKGTPCQLVGILGKGLVRIKCKSASGKMIEGDELMSKIDYDDKRILV